METPHWYQTPNMVTASLKLKGIPPGKITARFREQYCAVYVGGESPDELMLPSSPNPQFLLSPSLLPPSDTVHWECHLADTIVPDKCKLSVGKVRAELKLKKANLIHWSEYEVSGSYLASFPDLWFVFSIYIIHRNKKVAKYEEGLETLIT